MNIPQGEEERPLAWTAILQETPILASDGMRLGLTREVIGSEAEDIFHGLVLSAGTFGTDVLIPAENVKTISNRQIETNLSIDEVRNLPPYEEQSSFHLGFVGLLGRRLGWVKDGRDDSRN